MLEGALLVSGVEEGWVDELRNLGFLGLSSLLAPVVPLGKFGG